MTYPLDIFFPVYIISLITYGSFTFYSIFLNNEVATLVILFDYYLYFFQLLFSNSFLSFLLNSSLWGLHIAKSSFIPSLCVTFFIVFDLFTFVVITSINELYY